MFAMPASIYYLILTIYPLSKNSARCKQLSLKILQFDIVTVSLACIIKFTNNIFSLDL